MDTSASFVFLDKPSGPSSHAMVDKLRKISSEKRVGHAGTLDPLASGLLILAIGRPATREIDRFMTLDKEYEFSARLGAFSDTYDSLGKVQESLDLSPVSEQKLLVLMRTFEGEIMQKPPAFSAKKVSGRKSYELARRGQILDLEPVPVFISHFDLLYYEWPIWRARVRCSKGTYIRSLVHDVGQALAVGALLTALRRTAIGPFSVTEALTPDEVDQTWPTSALTPEEVFHRL